MARKPHSPRGVGPETGAIRPYGRPEQPELQVWSTTSTIAGDDEARIGASAGARLTDAQTAGGGWGGSGGAGGTAGANLQLSGFFGEYTTGNSWPMVGH